MGEHVSQLLEGYQAAGVPDSEGVFTLNLAKAREKMAKFLLPDPAHAILKLVQAGVEGAQAVEIQLHPQLKVVYRDWETDSLKRITERLCSPEGDRDDATGYLTIALLSLLSKTDSVTLRLQGEQVRISQDLEWSETDQIEHGVLTVEANRSSDLPLGMMRGLLRDRCGFAPIPIRVDGKQLEPLFPQTSGKHRVPYFDENTVVAAQTHRGPGKLDLHSSQQEVRLTGRRARMRLTVDMNPSAQVWLARSGVMIEKKSMALGAPGMVALVCVDDLETDITGMQVVKNQAYFEFQEWLQVQSAALRDAALARCGSLKSERKPASLTTALSARSTMYSFLALTLALSLIYSAWDQGRIDGNDFAAYTLLSLLALLTGVICHAAWKGAQGDSKSHRLARQEVQRRLNEAMLS